MEYKEAIEIVGKFKEAIIKLELDARSYYAIKEECLKLEGKTKELKNELDELKRYKRYYNLLASVSNVEICKQCDGRGSFTYGLGEQGWAGEECGYCQGAGIVDKVVS